MLKEIIIQKLLVFERKILRRIFGPRKGNQIWSIRTDEELDKLINHKNIVNIAKTSVFTEQGNDVVNRHYSRKLLKMDILMFETCRANIKCNKHNK